MKNMINSINFGLENNHSEISCGNCWGHQEYTNQYIEKSIEVTRNKKDNFISSFVKKYIRTE